MFIFISIFVLLFLGHRNTTFFELYQKIIIEPLLNFVLQLEPREIVNFLVIGIVCFRL